MLSGTPPAPVGVASISPGLRGRELEGCPYRGWGGVGAYTVEEGPDPDGHVQQGRAQLYQVRQPRQPRHGLQGNRAVGMVAVIQATDHGCEQQRAVGLHLEEPYALRVPKLWRSCPRPHPQPCP